jgi:hypothetical protein
MPPQPAFLFPRSGGIGISTNCPVCGNAYDFRKVQVIQEVEGSVLMYIVCATCASAYLAMMSFGPHGLKLAGVMTDLASGEVRRFEAEPRPVTADDVLSAHELVNDESHFFKSLSEPGPDPDDKE